MHYRTLGRTGLRVSVLAFGAGPVSGLMTGDDHALPAAVLRRAVERGINWIDTAPGYGAGKSETHIGRALREVDGSDAVHIATKVRLSADGLADVAGAVRKSVEQSLARLGRSSVTLLQLHNGMATRRGDEPFAIAPHDILNDVLPAFQRLRDDGLIQFLGLTGTGQPAALREVVASAAFDTIQVPYNLLNPSAGEATPATFADTNYGNIIADCAAQNMGVFAIRVYAGGALLDNPPSAHTLTTPFFPLPLYERDRVRARRLGGDLQGRAVRFALAHPRIHSAIVGFGAPEHVDSALAALD